MVSPWILVSGCLDASGGEKEEDENETMNEKDENGEEDGVKNDEDEGIERLPDRSPLADSLAELVEADDREAFAERRNLDYRNGEVQVLVELEPDGERPDEYLSEVTTEFRTMIIAWVKIDELVDLALDENVRSVRPEPPAHPHGEQLPR